MTIEPTNVNFWFLNAMAEAHYAHTPCPAADCHTGRYFLDRSRRLMFRPEVGEQLSDSDFLSDQPCVRAFEIVGKPLAP